MRKRIMSATSKELEIAMKEYAELLGKLETLTKSLNEVHESLYQISILLHNNITDEDVEDTIENNLFTF